MACQITTMAAVRETSVVEVRVYVELLRRMVRTRVLFHDISVVAGTLEVSGRTECAARRL